MNPLRFPLLLALLASACYRSDVREVKIRLPEARNQAELQALANTLLEKNTQVLDTSPMILEVTPHQDPPALSVRFNARMLATKNIEHHFAQLGFTANDLPGDETARARFRQVPQTLPEE